MYKEKLQKIIIESFILDEIDIISYIDLTESIENLSEGKIQVIKKALALSKKITSLNKIIPFRKAKISKMVPGPAKDKALAQVQKLEQANNRLKKIRTTLYVGGISTAVGSGVVAATKA